MSGLSHREFKILTVSMLKTLKEKLATLKIRWVMLAERRKLYEKSNPNTRNEKHRHRWRVPAIGSSAGEIQPRQESRRT